MAHSSPTTSGASSSRSQARSTLTGVTVRDNSGPGLETQGGITTATNVVFADSTPDCLIAQGSVVDGGGSTDSDGTCGFSTPDGAPDAVQDRIELDEDGTFVAPAPGVLATTAIRTATRSPPSSKTT